MRRLTKRALAGGSAAAALLLLTSCGGSSPQQPALVGSDTTATSTQSLPAPAPTALARSCQRPDATISTTLAARLDDSVEVRQAALLQTSSSEHGSPVDYLAGIVYREGNRVGVAVWASSTPTQADGWIAVDAAALQASHVLSAAGTSAELSKNLADYSHVASCATLGF